jgi:transcriptional regulator, marR family protein
MDAWRSFLAASTSVTARLNRELEAGCGISMHEYEILVRLSEAPDHTLRMSTLAEHVSHSRSRLTHTVRRLESAGYVERTSCDSDRRGVNCMLTQAGLDFLCDAAPVHLDGVRRHVIDRLGQEQQLAMAELMKVIAQAPDSSASSVLSASSAS